MCGVVGIVGTGPVNQSLYDALLVLQHRGQDAAGIMTCENGRLHCARDNGLARDVFRYPAYDQPARQYGYCARALSDCRLLVFGRGSCSTSIHLSGSVWRTMAT